MTEICAGGLKEKEGGAGGLEKVLFFLKNEREEGWEKVLMGQNILKGCKYVLKAPPNCIEKKIWRKVGQGLRKKRMAWKKLQYCWR